MKKAINMYLDWFENHKWVVRITMSVLFVAHCILNQVYMGKPVPITRIVLQEWMACANVICMSLFTGIMWVITDFKK